MKFKAIKAAAHNFSHSFVSYMNYVDDGYVIDDLREMARTANGKRISIQWIPENQPALFSLPKRVRRSMLYYQKWLPKHLKAHGVSLGMLQELKTEVFLAKNRQVLVESVAKDARSKEYVQYVSY